MIFLCEKITISQGKRADHAEFINRYDAVAKDFYDRLVTGDETWIYQYNPESKILFFKEFIMGVQAARSNS